jgi:hypothetical protein
MRGSWIVSAAAKLQLTPYWLNAANSQAITRAEAAITEPTATLKGPISTARTTSSSAIAIPASAVNHETVARSLRWLDVEATGDPDARGSPEADPGRGLGPIGVMRCNRSTW